MSVPRVLVTGASGFVGQALVLRLLSDKKFLPVCGVRGVSRLSDLCEVVPFDLNTGATLSILTDVQVVVHAAARVHVMRETASDSLAAFRLINVDGTVKLAKDAAKAGVKRFVFISSIKVSGEQTVLGVPFKSSDKPAPMDAYGISKREAEDALREIATETGMEVVIIRPPLVYGPGVKANFLNMLQWLERGVPLPLGAIHNRRSMVALENLVDLVVRCIDHPKAANNTFLVSDNEDLSTTELLQRASHALGVRPRLVPIPACVVLSVASMLGKQALARRLCGSLQLDISSTCEILEWAPPINVDKALSEVAVHYLEHKTK